jgi:hypothetical protein
MSHGSKKTERVHSNDVLAVCRARITSGHWTPGKQISTKVDLCNEFNAAPGTIQRVLDQLTSEGFLRSKGRWGTVVRDHPPHLHRLGLVFEMSRSFSLWGDALYKSAVEFGKRRVGGIQCYFNCRQTPDGPSRELLELQDDVMHGRLAGMISVANLHSLAGTSIVSKPGLAFVNIGRKGTMIDGIAPSAIDFNPPAPMAMRFFAERGLKRLALVLTVNQTLEAEAILASAQTYGLKTQPYLTHFVPTNEPHSAQRYMELTMRLPKAIRPDAIYIGDDNLAGLALRGIAEAGLGPRERFDVIAHVNFPSVEASPLPVVRLGFDAQTVLTTALNVIDLQLAGKAAPTLTIIDPVFDFERAKSMNIPTNN